ncbi:hypothetical protein F5H01DRAFT_383504 [Linnemannia elongata]|nr:hypothetical protein F5H01DRAFT_383504 [Linnemannia elongata]
MKYLVCLQRDGYSHTLRILRVPTTTPSSLQYFVTASISTPSTSAASSSSPTLNRSGSAFILSPRTVLLASSVSRPLLIRDIDNRTAVDVVTDIVGTSVLLCQSFSDAITRSATTLHASVNNRVSPPRCLSKLPVPLDLNASNSRLVGICIQCAETLRTGHKEETLGSSRLHTRLLESSSAAPPFLRLPLFGPSFSIFVILEGVVKAFFSIEFPRTCEIFSQILYKVVVSDVEQIITATSIPKGVDEQSLYPFYTAATPQGSERTRLRSLRTTTVSACEDPVTKVKLSAGNQDKVVKKPAVKKANGKGMKNKAENVRY